jgi:hypothetical protein
LRKGSDRARDRADLLFCFVLEVCKKVKELVAFWLWRCLI